MKENCEGIFKKTLFWIIIFSVEALVILFANIITIIVFWKRRFQLRKTSVVLINLSIADILVGVGTIEEFISFICSLSWFKTYFVLAEFSSCASINFLVLVSLERVYAIVWPLRSRSTSKRTYIYAVVAAWLISGIAPAFSLLIRKSRQSDEDYSWIGSLYIGACLLTITVAYSVTWFFSKKKDPKLSEYNFRRNKNLAKTLFVVTVLSLITWLPFVVVFSVILTERNISAVSPIYRCLQLANSFINPIIYCFRMPIFRETLRATFLLKKKIRISVRGHKTRSKADAVVLTTFSNLNVFHSNIRPCGSMLSNSFINLITYCYRMPMFRETLRKTLLIRKKKTQLKHLAT
ncbi:tachykinin-like peptides receptor 99D [Stylophora pistillata]|uniref:tachykinin-like peptides receptor 99D n=1 Tax=Stylophora pistillata TaxID=50429 RepID=UPI000C03E001|nr:tachykinin-like peptides receptor 99D [Stylophora pistillata]